MTIRSLILVVILSLLTSCVAKGNKQEEETNTTIEVPTFNADSAYQYVKDQCDFGPRVPGTTAHAECLEYFKAQFSRFEADTVIIQEGEAKIYNGGKMPIRNVVASYGITKTNRIIISSHWDSRPYADNDINPANRKKPIIGANDGASGVGVIIELARQMSLKNSKVGVDLILFDLEDYGAPDWEKSVLEDGGWALGSAYWSRHPHEPGYQAQYGILLDMVGAVNAKFHREYISDKYAKWVMDKVWNRAAEMGLSHTFINQPGGGVTDDHVNVLKAGIPCIDIIQFQQDTESGFGDYWHTQRDDINIIDRNTLNVVGQLMLQLIYNP